LDPIALTNIDFDVKGEAFEHFLEQTTSTENDLGEYFTPRHIVKFIVNLVDPKFKETVYDPFCGTGGFLTESFKYIKDNTIIKTPEDEELLKENTIYGREITLNARIAKMNMILQGDGHSGIEKTDSLANPVEGLYDIVITNMPFSLPTTHSNLYQNGLAKNNGDSVCVLHCFNSLKEGGRMALVVPEGFLFRKDSANVREFLLKHSKLQAVISLPQGAFLPYTAVKTDVLYFIAALIGSRVKCEPKTKMKDLYLTCYTRLLEISANNFSALWLNSNYDLFSCQNSRFFKRMLKKRSCSSSSRRTLLLVP
jgi:type I restriction enzyme M protein